MGGYEAETLWTAFEVASRGSNGVPIAGLEYRLGIASGRANVDFFIERETDAPAVISSLNKFVKAMPVLPHS